MPGIHEPMRSVLEAHVIYHAAANRNFDPLNRVHHQQSQLAVEHIKRKNLLKRRSRRERLVRNRQRLERQPIGREPVVTDELEVMQRSGVFAHEQPRDSHFWSCRARVRAGFVNFIPVPSLKMEHLPWCADPTRGVAGLVPSLWRSGSGGLTVGARRINVPWSHESLVCHSMPVGNDCRMDCDPWNVLSGIASKCRRPWGNGSSSCTC